MGRGNAVVPPYLRQSSKNVASMFLGCSLLVSSLPPPSAPPLAPGGNTATEPRGSPQSRLIIYRFRKDCQGCEGFRIPQLSGGGSPSPNRAKRLECAQLAAAVARPTRRAEQMNGRGRVSVATTNAGWVEHPSRLIEALL